MSHPLENLLPRIENDFSYHKADEGMIHQMNHLRELCKELALNMALNVPPGRELATALTKLEEAMFHANAGITRKAPKDESIQPQILR